MNNLDPDDLRTQALRCRSVAERRRPIIELADHLESKAADLERETRR